MSPIGKVLKGIPTFVWECVGDDETLLEFLLIWCVMRFDEFRPTATNSTKISQSHVVSHIGFNIVFTVQLGSVSYLQVFSQEVHIHFLLKLGETAVYLRTINPKRIEKRSSGIHNTV